MLGHITSLLKTLEWLPISARVKPQLTALTDKLSTICFRPTPYLSDCITTHSAWLPLFQPHWLPHWLLNTSGILHSWAHCSFPSLTLHALAPYLANFLASFHSAPVSPSPTLVPTLSRPFSSLPFALYHSTYHHITCTCLYLIIFTYYPQAT